MRLSPKDRLSEAVSKQEADGLIATGSPFTLEKIKSTDFEFGGNKVPRLDGIPLQFFKQFFESTKEDHWKLCEDFYFGKANLERIN